MKIYENRKEVIQWNKLGKQQKSSILSYKSSIIFGIIAFLLLVLSVAVSILRYQNQPKETSEQNSFFFSVILTVVESQNIKQLRDFGLEFKQALIQVSKL